LYYYIIRVACLYVATNKVVRLVDPINIFVFFLSSELRSRHPKILHVVVGVNKQQEFHFEGRGSANIPMICLLDLSPVVYDNVWLLSVSMFLYTAAFHNYSLVPIVNTTCSISPFRSADQLLHAWSSWDPIALFFRKGNMY
jgi:hypothetical protein